MRKSDWLALLAVSFLGIVSLFAVRWAGADSKKPQAVSIEVDGTVYRRLRVDGPMNRILLKELGMVVEFGQGRMRVVTSNCPAKICVKTGWISRPGQTILCVPNRTLFRMTGSASMDAVSK